MAELRALQTVPLEHFLDRLQTDEAPQVSTRRRELVALRYYLRDLLWDIPNAWDAQAPGQTNYHLILQRLDRWRESVNTRVALVTFNYDTLLDRAMEDVLGIPLRSIEQYIADPRFRLFKPHGSVNWVRIVANDSPIQKGQSATTTEREITNLAGREGLQLAEGYTVVADYNSGTLNGRAVVPALTIPVLEKRDFEFPSEHQAALQDWLYDVLWVLVIGWRASEHNFLRFWSGATRVTQPRMLAACRTIDTGQAVFAALREHDIRPSRDYSFEGGFTEFLAKGLLEDLLSAP